MNLSIPVLSNRMPMVMLPRMIVIPHVIVKSVVVKLSGKILLN